MWHTKENLSQIAGVPSAKNAQFVGLVWPVASAIQIIQVVARARVS